MTAGLSTPQRLRFQFDIVADDVDRDLPLVYMWEVLDETGEATYRYVGKAERGASRPLTHYRRNVNNLLAGRPYRRGNADGFRLVHRELAQAVRLGLRARVTLLANAAPGEDLRALERQWQAKYAVNPDDGDPGGDSIEQRLAEPVVLDALESRLGRRLERAPRRIASGVRVELDAICEEPPTLVEVWAHQGLPKPAQKHKVLADALKLVWVDRALYKGGAEKILALASREAAHHFTGQTWAGRALHDLGVRVEVVDLPPDVAERIRAAQARQAIGMGRAAPRRRRASVR